MSPFEMTHRAIGDANTALRKLNETLEEEVQRIALALHDDAGQLMVAVHLSLDEATRDLPPEVQARMSGVKTLLGLVEERIRDLSHELRPAMLDHLGLVPAVEFLAANFGQRTGLHITVDSSLNGQAATRIRHRLLSRDSGSADQRPPPRPRHPRSHPDWQARQLDSLPGDRQRRGL